MTATKWKPGIADDAWKVMICARDAERAKDLIMGVAYILDSHLGHASTEAAANVLRSFTGAEIADALLAFRDKAHQSVVRGIAKADGGAA